MRHEHFDSPSSSTHSRTHDPGLSSCRPVSTDGMRAQCSALRDTIKQKKAFVLGRPGRRHVVLSVCTKAVGAKVVAIAHIAKAFDLQFIFNRAIILKWQSELIMNGLKIMCMRFEQMVFLDIYVTCPFRCLNCQRRFAKISKAWYPHYFNTENHEYVGPVPDIQFYGASEISEAQRKDYWSGMKIRRASGVLTTACLNRTIRITQQFCTKHVRLSGANLWR
jgi:hypothetical protein